MCSAASSTRSRTSSAVSTRVDRRHHADEEPLVRLQVAAEDLQHVDAIGLAGERDVEPPGAELQQAWEQVGVVDVGAVGRVAVAARARVHAHARSFGRGQAAQRQVVQVDEAVQQVAAGIELHRQAGLGEIHLHRGGAGRERSPDPGNVLGQQVLDEFVTGVASNPLRRIHQAERGRRDDRLLDRRRGVAPGDRHVFVGVALVAEGTGGQPRHPAGVASGERDPEPVGGRVRQPVHGVGPEVVVLALLAVGHHGRPGRLELRDGVLNRGLVEGLEARVLTPPLGDGVEQGRRPGNATDGLGRKHELGGFAAV